MPCAIAGPATKPAKSARQTKPATSVKGLDSLQLIKVREMDLLHGGVLKIRNRTPFIVVIYIAKVRAGWIKPFRTEEFRGLKEGRHKVSAVSHYGSAFWEPRLVHVPGTWNLTPEAGVNSSEMETALVLRIYRRNRSSLVACDKLAERRGEELGGNRADFEVAVTSDGKGNVKVIGGHLSKRLLACYRAVAMQWEYPSTGVPYTVEFQHLH